MTKQPAPHRQLIGSIGANVSWSRTANRAARTAPGRAAFLRKFEEQVDPDGVLPEAERRERAESARRAHFQQMALKSAKTRAQRKADMAPANLTQLLRNMRGKNKPANNAMWFDTGCAICGKPDDGSNLVMDHDHDTGFKRGVLCRGCNNVEGWRSDSADFGLWQLWRTTAPLLNNQDLYVPGHIRLWLEQNNLTVTHQPIDKNDLEARAMNSHRELFGDR